jgi:hypothetical protein
MKKRLHITAPVVLATALTLMVGSGVALAKGGNGNGGHGNGHAPSAGTTTSVAHGNGHGGGPGHQAVTATGSTTCHFHGQLRVAADGSLSLSGNITPSHGPACTSTGGAKIKTGHLTALAGATPTTTTTVAPTTTTSSTTSTTSTTTTSTTTTSTTTTTVAPTTTSSSTTTTLASCSLLPSGALADLTGGTIMWSPKAKVATSTGVAFTGGTVSVVTNGGGQYLSIVYTGGSVAGGSFATASGVSLSLTSHVSLSELASACAAGSGSIAVNGTITL